MKFLKKKNMGQDVPQAIVQEILVDTRKIQDAPSLEHVIGGL